MFGLGIWEVVVIIIVAIVFINPKDLPKLARKIGQWYRKLKNMTGKISEEFKDLEKEINGTSEDSITASLNSTVNEIKDGLRSPMESLKIHYKLPKLDSIMPSFGKASGEVKKEESVTAEDGNGKRDEQFNGE